MMLKISSPLLLAALVAPSNAQQWGVDNTETVNNQWDATDPPTAWPTPWPTPWPTASTDLPTPWPTEPPLTAAPTEPPVEPPVEQANNEAEQQDAVANDEAQVDNEGGVDCSQFQASHSFDGIPITMNYVVTLDDASPNKGLFSAEVIFEGVGWVGMGISDEGLMVPGIAVIGLPDEDLSASNPGKYDLTSRSPAGVTLAGAQTILNGDIQQNETHTVLTFQKFLEEDGEPQAIDPQGTNFFLVAAGSGNDLGFHAVRGSVGLNLVPCVEGADPGSIQVQEAVSVEIDNKQSLFKSHGAMMALAWGILAPLAIANSMCRHLIPKTGFWFVMHRGLNVLVLVFTLIAFGLAYSAIQQLGGTHFESGEGTLGKHKTIGLVVVILTVMQAAGGILRPHVPAKDDDGNEIEGKTAVRTAWEFMHKLSGYAILFMGWYQCHSGLKLYALRFVQDNDYVGVFWGIAGTIAAVGVGGKLHGMFVHQEPEKETTRPTSAGEKGPSQPSSSAEPTEQPTLSAPEQEHMDDVEC